MAMAPQMIGPQRINRYQYNIGSLGAIRGSMNSHEYVEQDLKKQDHHSDSSETLLFQKAVQHTFAEMKEGESQEQRKQQQYEFLEYCPEVVSKSFPTAIDSKTCPEAHYQAEQKYQEDSKPFAITKKNEKE
jgi:hypothetical protein